MVSKIYVGVLNLANNPTFLIERKINIIQITKAEKDIICERFPNVHIVRTMRQRSKRHRYYCVETQGVMNLIGKLRGWDTRPNKRRR